MFDEGSIPPPPQDDEPDKNEEKLINEALEKGYSEMSTWSFGQIAERGDGFGSVYQDGVREHYATYRLHWGQVDEVAPLQGASLGPEKFFSGWSYGQFNEWLNINGMYEAVVIAPATKYEQKTRVVGQKSKMLGLKKQDITETYWEPAGTKTMNDYLGNGSEDSAAILSYRVLDRDDPNFPYELRYRDGVRRWGNSLNLQIVLPLEVASLIGEKVEEDPMFIRKLTEAFVREKYSRKFREETWEKYGRPPYKGYDSRPEPKMYLADLTKPDSPENPNAKVLPIKPVAKSSK